MYSPALSHKILHTDACCHSRRPMQSTRRRRRRAPTTSTSMSMAKVPCSLCSAPQWPKGLARHEEKCRAKLREQLRNAREEFALLVSQSAVQDVVLPSPEHVLHSATEDIGPSAPENLTRSSSESLSEDTAPPPKRGMSPVHDRFAHAERSFYYDIIYLPGIFDWQRNARTQQEWTKRLPWPPDMNSTRTLSTPPTLS